MLPAPPKRLAIPSGSKAELLDRIKEALRALPVHFQSTTNIEGLDAGDLFTLNSVLGGTIEVQVVKTLNRLRTLWDPHKQWEDFHFVRSSQTFPDVRLLAARASGPEIALGLELKGWYLLSREGEPSFRYRVTPSACSPYDQLVVVPWHLSNVLAGEPVVYEPYVEQAYYAAEFRNYHWQHQRPGTPNTAITPPPGAVLPYPAPKTKISDNAVSDRGNNFGRVARIHGLMEPYVDQMMDVRVAGITAGNWIRFFQLHKEGITADVISRQLAGMLEAQAESFSSDDAARVMELLRELVRLIPSP